MKTVVFGDIHGRLFWSDVLEEEQPDRVIFLGDYVSTHERISARQQLQNLDRILDYKEARTLVKPALEGQAQADCPQTGCPQGGRPQEVILLRGNHDTQHLGYYWARCSGLDSQVKRGMPSERYLKLTQWIYVDEALQTVFSHAGISKVWMEKWGIEDIGQINAMEPSEVFGFSLTDRWDNYGDHPTQPPTWIRPQTLETCCIKGWNQVVGHTPVENIVSLHPQASPEKRIWLCDAMGKRQYLVIEGSEFEARTWEKPDREKYDGIDNKNIDDDEYYYGSSW